MIEVDGLSKKYGDFEAVKNISFSAGQGEIIGFLGPNGAGKTTTLRMLTTYMPPSSGTARVAGFDILKESEQVRRRIGYLPETPPLYSEMTVTEYLRFIADIKSVPSKNKREAVGDVIERCFLSGVRNRLCRHLSRGYRQRVGLAQAIIHDPEVVILDEPTSGLDPRQIIEIRKLIKSLSERKTVILSTHILQEVEMICSRVVVINRGQVVLSKSLDEVRQTETLEEMFLRCTKEELFTDAASEETNLQDEAGTQGNEAVGE